MKRQVTASMVRELLCYDDASGLFVRPRSSQGAKAGPAGCIRRDGYVVISVGGYQHLAHRLAWLYTTGEWPTDLIDHINGERSDNRWSNLREASKQTNGQNMRRASAQNTTSGLLGAHFDKRRGMWRACIRAPVLDGKIKSRNIEIGVFSSAEKAHAAYVAAKRRLHAGCTL